MRKRGECYQAIRLTAGLSCSSGDGKSNCFNFSAAFIKADENVTFFSFQRDSCDELSMSESGQLKRNVFPQSFFFFFCLSLLHLAAGSIRVSQM